MVKRIGFNGIKKCKDGELYRFKKGLAKIPGFKLNNSPIFITLTEFNKLKGD